MIMTIYDEIKAIAFHKGLSIRQIEKSLNLSNGTIGKWNRSSPSIANIKKVSDFLNVDINTLVYLADKDRKEVI